MCCVVLCCAKVGGCVRNVRVERRGTCTGWSGGAGRHSSTCRTDCSTKQSTQTHTDRDTQVDTHRERFVLGRDTARLKRMRLETSWPEEGVHDRARTMRRRRSSSSACRSRTASPPAFGAQQQTASERCQPSILSHTCSVIQCSMLSFTSVACE